MQQGAPAAGGSVQGDAMDSSVEVSTAAKLTPEPTETPALGAPPSLDETQPEPQPELLSGTVTAGSTPLDPSVEEPAADHAAAPPVGFTVPAAEPTSQLSQMLAQFRQLQATAPEGREKMLAELPMESHAASGSLSRSCLWLATFKRQRFRPGESRQFVVEAGGDGHVRVL